MQDPKKANLKKHKYLATGLFFLMTLIYGFMIYGQHHSPAPWMGYIEAFSEAGMVGALADWFAVTALFKHPMGLPIPHTNLIHRKKKDLGENLGEFVNTNFLSPQTIRPYIEKLDPTQIAARWLDNPKNREVLEVELCQLIRKIIADLNDEQVAHFITQKSTQFLKNLNYQNLAASGIQYLIHKNEHLKLLETLLPQTKIYIEQNQEIILNRLYKNRPFVAFMAGKKISREVTDGLIAFIEEIQLDHNHFVRKKLEEKLENFSQEVRNSPKWDEKFEQLKTELISSTPIKDYAKDAWKAIKTAAIKDLDKENSKLQFQLKKNIGKLTHNISHDQHFKTRVDSWVRYFIYRMIMRNRSEVKQLISSTVSSWEGQELSNKLELEVGKDLQFIRINGTLVGGLVGLIIYTITHLFI